MRRGAILYTDNSLPTDIWDACQAQLRRCLDVTGLSIVTVSHKPVDLGQNVVMDLPRSAESMFRQILAGLETSDAEVVYLIEHDVLYPVNHFGLIPSEPDYFYYNRNQWHVWSEDGRAFRFDHDDPSQLCARRSLLLEHYRRVVNAVEAQGYHSSWGFSPPRGLPSQMRRGRCFYWRSTIPTIDIRHPGTLTRSQFSPADFRNPAGCRGWTEADAVPYWGRTRGRFAEWLAEVPCESA